MPLFGKERKPEQPSIPHHEDDKFGLRADMALLESFWDPSGEFPDPEVFRNLASRSQALVQGFLEEISIGISEEDPTLFAKSWRGAKTLVRETREHNRRVFLSEAQRKVQLGVQLHEFNELSEKIFGKKSLVTVDGERVVSTREGGIWWGIRHWVNVALNPQPKTHTRVENGNGSTYKASKKDYGIDPTLFDDYMHVGFRGIKFYNPDLDDEGVLYPWHQVGDLAFSFNTARFLDFWNSKIRPLGGKRVAQKPLSPFGVLKIADRPGRKVLVRIPMRDPDEFVEKLEKMAEGMRRVAVGPREMEEKPYIEIEHFLKALTPRMKEEVKDVLTRKRTNNRYSTSEAGKFRRRMEEGGAAITLGNARDGEFISWDELREIVKSNEHQELLRKLNKIRDKERNRGRRENLDLIIDRVMYMIERVLDNRDYGDDRRRR